MTEPLFYPDAMAFFDSKVKSRGVRDVRGNSWRASDLFDSLPVVTYCCCLDELRLMVRVTLAPDGLWITLEEDLACAALLKVPPISCLLTELDLVTVLP